MLSSRNWAFTGIDCEGIIWTVCSNAAPRCIRGYSSIVGVYMTSTEEKMRSQIRRLDRRQ